MKKIILIISIILSTTVLAKQSFKNIPSHIRENWHLLSSDQQKIIYSFHNDKKYFEMNKEYFSKVENESFYLEHNTKYGFDSNQQDRLDDLRKKINDKSLKELTDLDKELLSSFAD